jgi:hypothetical protein
MQAISVAVVIFSCGWRFAGSSPTGSPKQCSTMAAPQAVVPVHDSFNSLQNNQALRKIVEDDRESLCSEATGVTESRHMTWEEQKNIQKQHGQLKKNIMRQLDKVTRMHPGKGDASWL